MKEVKRCDTFLFILGKILLILQKYLFTFTPTLPNLNCIVDIVAKHPM